MTTDLYENTNDSINISIEHIENALCVLLTAYVRQRENPVGVSDIWSPGPLRLSEIPMGKQAELLSLCEDPLAHALRDSIKKLAAHLNEYYSAESGHMNNWGKMGDSLNRIAEMSDCSDVAIEAYADKLFDGIGGWLA